MTTEIKASRRRICEIGESDIMKIVTSHEYPPEGIAAATGNTEGMNDDGKNSLHMARRHKADAMNTKDPTHLGDGAYAGHDGYQLWIGANHHENMTVALDMGAFAALVRYAEKTLGWKIKTKESDNGL